MGAWGEKAFQNDSALDWLSDFEADGLDALRDILGAVAESPLDEYLDVDDGSPAIVAAEIVAAALGHGRERVPKGVTRWLDANPSAITADDRELARRAVERVVGKSSELRGLWDDAGSDSGWHADVAILLERLGGDPSAVHSEVSNHDDHDETEDQLKLAVLMFLRIRGLEPTAAQMARIQESTELDELRRWAERAASVPSVEALFGGPPS